MHDPPSATILDTYTGQPLEIVLVNITEDTVMEIVGLLSGGARMEGTDLVRLQQWILRLWAAIGELRLRVADFAEWLVNG